MKNINSIYFEKPRVLVAYTPGDFKEIWNSKVMAEVNWLQLGTTYT